MKNNLRVVECLKERVISYEQSKIKLLVSKSESVSVTVLKLYICVAFSRYIITSG